MSRATHLVIGFDPLWRTIANFAAVANLARLTAAFPASTKRWVTVEERIEKVFDCSTEHEVDEYVRQRLARLSIDFQVTPQLLAGFLAFLAGASAAPTGATANEVQTVTVTATGGTFILSLVTDAGTVTTVPIAFDASAAIVANAINTAINDAGYYGTGNVAVVKAGNVYTVTFGGKLAAVNMPLFTADATALTGVGAGVAVAETTAGDQRQHQLSLMAGHAVPLLALVVGFKDDPSTAVIFKAGVNSVRVAFGADDRVTATVELIGSARLDPATGYTMPDCAAQDIVRTADCRLSVDGGNVAGLVDGEITVGNALLVDDDAWTTASPDMDRLERADQRTFAQTFSVFGNPSPSTQLWADAVSRVNRNVAFRIGRPGNNVILNSPKATIRRNGDGIGFARQSRRSTLTLGADPKFDEASPATTEMNFLANVPLATQYLAA
jgi:hypothetical protein